MAIKIDIHNAKKRTERAKINLQKKFSGDNAKIVCKFMDRLRLDNKSYGRIANYAECIGRILEIKDDKKIKEWTREEIEFIHKTIADSDYENSVKKDTLTGLKRICHFAVHGEIADKAKGKEYDPLVAWITPGSFKDKYQKVQSKDLLTDDEILQLIQATKRMGGRYVKRNIAIIFVLLEGAYRPGELLDIRISGIEFEKDFVRIYTTGKTGPKSLTLVASFEPIKEWLAEHPYSDDPDAFLFYHDNADGLIPYHRFSELIKRTRDISGIKKRIWPYLFRHTALTEYSKKLGNVAKIYGNWSRGSNKQPYVNAPAVLVFCMDPSRVKLKFPPYILEKFSMQDATLAASYAQIAAAGLGLSSIWIGMIDEEKIKSILGTDLRPSSILCIGYLTRKGLQSQDES